MLTTLYFLVCSIAIWLGFAFYGRMLLLLGGKGWFNKNILGFIIYFLFACYLILPILIAFDQFEDWRVRFVADRLYMTYFCMCFILSVVPGGIYFFRKYMADLRAAGYFSKSGR